MNASTPQASSGPHLDVSRAGDGGHAEEHDTETSPGPRHP